MAIRLAGDWWPRDWCPERDDWCPERESSGRRNRIDDIGGKPRPLLPCAAEYKGGRSFHLRSRNTIGPRAGVPPRHRHRTQPPDKTISPAPRCAVTDARSAAPGGRSSASPSGRSSSWARMIALSSMMRASRLTPSVTACSSRSGACRLRLPGRATRVPRSRSRPRDAGEHHAGEHTERQINARTVRSGLFRFGLPTRSTSRFRMVTRVAALLVLTRRRSFSAWTGSTSWGHWSSQYRP